MQELHVVDAAELAATYAAAQYAVALDGDSLPIGVGALATDLEAYWPASRYLLITAWNPASQPRSDAANQAADAQLVAEIDALGVVRHPAWAQGADGEWHEPAWLVAEVDDATSEFLAREFGQAGILAWARGQPVRLRMLMPAPRQPLKNVDPEAAACIDWVE